MADISVVVLTMGDRPEPLRAASESARTQRGVDIEAFDRRADQRFWKGVQEILPVWDEMIDVFNERTGV